MSSATLAPDTDEDTGPGSTSRGAGNARWGWLALVAFVLVPVIIIAGLLGYMLLLARTDAAQCQPSGPSVQVNTADLPAGPVAGFGTGQLRNAAAILAAGAALGLGQRDQTIGVMTAIGEASLQVLDRGDAAGADSRGLFQQRGNGAWGTYADRMDPTTSSLNFFRVLAQVPDRESKSPTQVAHTVQRNADPNYYAQFWDQAVTITAALAATSATGSATPAQAGATVPAAAAAATQITAQTTAATPGQGAAGGGAAACAGAPGASAAVNATGWASPAHGTLTSPFGWRVHPTAAARTYPYAQDIANTCGTPIYAAADGTVTRRGFDSGGNGVIAIDDGTATIDGKAVPIYTRYLHEYESGMFVNVGDVVKAGQQIGQIGSSGGSTGCHLHFEVNVGGSPVDPVAFMAGRGVTLGS